MRGAIARARVALRSSRWAFASAAQPFARWRAAGCVLGALLTLAAGCASPAHVGPSQQAQERAFTLSWEGTLGMDGAARPSVTWVSDCRSEFWGVRPQGYCFVETLTDRGDAIIEWKGDFRASEWASSLVSWRDRLLFTSWHSADDDRLVRQINDALAGADL